MRGRDCATYSTRDGHRPLFGNRSSCIEPRSAECTHAQVGCSAPRSGGGSARAIRRTTRNTHHQCQGTATWVVYAFVFAGTHRISGGGLAAVRRSGGNRRRRAAVPGRRRRCAAAAVLDAARRRQSPGAVARRRATCSVAARAMRAARGAAVSCRLFFGFICYCACVWWGGSGGAI